MRVKKITEAAIDSHTGFLFKEKNNYKENWENSLDRQAKYCNPITNEIMAFFLTVIFLRIKDHHVQIALELKLLIMFIVIIFRLVPYRLLSTCSSIYGCKCFVYVLFFTVEFCFLSFHSPQHEFRAVVFFFRHFFSWFFVLFTFRLHFLILRKICIFPSILYLSSLHFPFPPLFDCRIVIILIVTLVYFFFLSQCISSFYFYFIFYRRTRLTIMISFVLFLIFIFLCIHL